MTMFRLPVIYTCFPGGRHKVLTMSYDDGRQEDYRLVELFNKHGIKGTFNLNAGIDWVVIRDTSEEFRVIPTSEWIESDDSLSGVFGY